MKRLRTPHWGWCLAGLLVWTGCGQDTNFAGNKFAAEDRRSEDANPEVVPEEEVAPPDPKEVPKNIPPDVISSGDERFTAEIQTNEGQTVTIDNFLLPRSFPVVQRLENSDNPVKMHTVEQSIGEKTFGIEIGCKGIAI